MPDLGPLEIVALALGFVGGSYGTGTWLGKVLATSFGFDRAFWGDIGGILGGLIGLGLFVGYFLGRVFV